MRLKKRQILKPKLKRLVSETMNNSWTLEETEKFIENSYTGEWNAKHGKFHNFPWKPIMKKKEVIESIDRLKEVIDLMKDVPAFAFDTETNTLDVLGPNRNFRLVDITISWGENNNYEIPLGHLRDEDIERNLDLDIVIPIIKPVFENPNVTIVGTNLKFDMHVMQRVGIHITSTLLFDIMLASWICDENSPNGLKENSTEKMGVSQTHFKEITDSIPNNVKKQFGYKANAKIHDFGLVLIDEGADYCIGDAYYTWCNFLGFRKEVEDIGMSNIYYKKMIPFLRVLFNMEEQGVPVDKKKLERMGEDMQKDMEDLQYNIFEKAGCEFNLGSPAQKSLILFGVDDYSMEFKEYLEKYKKKNAKKIAKSGLDIEKVRKTYIEKKNDSKRIEILNNSFKFQIQKFTAKGSPSTDNDTIWILSNKNYISKRKKQGVEMCKLMAQYSKLSKLKSAFVDGIIEKLEVYSDGKVHPSFNQCGTDSGRLSCSSPNLQQLPKAEEEDKYQIRSVFIGGEYYVNKLSGELKDNLSINDTPKEWEKKRKKIIAIDYHNLEMVCLAHFSGDKNLIEMFENDDDAHGSTAVNMFELDCTPLECKKKYPHLRQAAKTLNFLLMYGGGARLLYVELKNDHFAPIDLGAKEYLERYHCKNGIEVAQCYIDKYFSSYSGVSKFIQSQKKFAHRNGYVLTVLGRKRRLPDINSSDFGVVSYCERLSVNSAIQGTAGDITSSAQIRIEEEQKLKEMLCYMLIQVHDELVFECPEECLEDAIKIIKHDMEFPFGDNSRNIKFLRADYDTGSSYQEAK